MPTLIIRTIIIYLFLIIAMRIGGKRQIGQMQLSELITALVLSELAISPISHEDTPLLFGIAPIFIVTSLEIICAFLSTKSNAAKRFFDGVPSVIVKRGELDIRELAKNRMGIEEFISETREQGIRDISDIDYAIIEADGRLSVFEKDIKNSGIAHVIIADGVVNRHGLDSVKMTAQALSDILNEENLALKDVFLYTVSDIGKETIILTSGKRIAAKKNRKGK